MTKLVVATYLRGSTADKTGLESSVRDSGLDWVITRPAVLTEEPATGDVRAYPSGGREQSHTVTRADLAVFLVAQLTSDDHLRKTVIVDNR